MLFSSVIYSCTFVLLFTVYSTEIEAASFEQNVFKRNAELDSMVEPKVNSEQEGVPKDQVKNIKARSSNNEDNSNTKVAELKDLHKIKRDLDEIGKLFLENVFGNNFMPSNLDQDDNMLGEPKKKRYAPPSQVINNKPDTKPRCGTCCTTECCCCTTECCCTTCCCTECCCTTCCCTECCCCTTCPPPCCCTCCTPPPCCCPTCCCTPPPCCCCTTECCPPCCCTECPPPCCCTECCPCECTTCCCCEQCEVDPKNPSANLMPNFRQAEDIDSRMLKLTNPSEALEDASRKKRNPLTLRILPGAIVDQPLYHIPQLMYPSEHDNKLLEVPAVKFNFVPQSYDLVSNNLGKNEPFPEIRYNRFQRKKRLSMRKADKLKRMSMEDSGESNRFLREANSLINSIKGNLGQESLNDETYLQSSGSSANGPEAKPDSSHLYDNMSGMAGSMSMNNNMDSGMDNGANRAAAPGAPQQKVKSSLLKLISYGIKQRDQDTKQKKSIDDSMMDNGDIDAPMNTNRIYDISE